MLFEISYARSEIILRDARTPDWAECLAIASDRQREHYDAVIPSVLKDVDRDIASHASNNLVYMLRSISNNRMADIEFRPRIPGLGWIAPGNGDFAIANTIIEVKHIETNFRSSDLRQILMYWLLKYAAAIEGDIEIWTDAILLNPRSNKILQINFDDIVRIASAEMNRVELLEMLRSLLADNLGTR